MSYAWQADDTEPDLADVAAGVDDDVLAVRADRHLFDELTPLEREVIVKRFGLDGETPHRLMDLETELHLRRHDLREVQQSALSKLRSHLA